MHTLQVNGAKLTYRLDAAAGSAAPLLVLSNSLGTRMEMWDAQLAGLVPRFRVLRYDTRGHGRSEVGAHPYSFDLLGQDVLALADEVGEEQFDFCGLSMGGLTGQWLGIHAPERVRRLVLSNTAALIGTPATWNPRIELVRAQGMQALTEGVLERWFTAGFRDTHPMAVAPVRANLLTTPAQGYAACCEAIRDADFRDAIANIRAPTLVIAGAFDPSTPPADGAFLAGRIPNARYVELPCAHLSNIECANEFNQALDVFFKETHHG
ncbi:MAG: 3-oxoadipate enol-lactonase [Burkholderiaceae bacterium]|jgi:3-oxoadipate enol-lactonase